MPSEPFQVEPLPFPEIRTDPFTGIATLYSTERAARPGFSLFHEDDLVSDASCPFCEGHEAETPPEVFAIRDGSSSANAPGWSVRVIPNRFAAVVAEAPPGGHDSDASRPGYGLHDVVIESPNHVPEMGDFDCEQVFRVLVAWRERLKQVAANPRILHSMPFKNSGRGAGASVEHAHSQIISLPLVPTGIREMVERMSKSHALTGNCMLCDWVKRERERGTYLIDRNEAVGTFVFPAGRWPFETWLVPLEHHARFEAATGELLHDLATALHRLLVVFRERMPGIAYNLVLKNPPFREAVDASFHWQLHVLPRLTFPAGWEWGSGWHINPVPPEQAARFLKAGIQLLG